MFLLWCCNGENVIKMHTDDIILLSPSAKGMQRILEKTHAYGCDYDILLNNQTSQLMILLYHETRLSWEYHIR